MEVLYTLLGAAIAGAGFLLGHRAGQQDIENVVIKLTSAHVRIQSVEHMDVDDETGRTITGAPQP